ncbi:hypothetical protein F4054_04245 [Candidatus Poribacteria bacterium]|nr:hypothetical protein [Candidatus Poribacteria bacterium]MYK21454.1 hypothetical protein [Candidatus Poribacteria bacterium]
MRYSRFRRFRVVVLMGIVALTLLFSSDSIAQADQSSLSGRVVDTKGKPVAGLELGIKPVEITKPRDIVPRTPFASWLRAVTDKRGRFSFHSIDAGSSQFVMFPESASDFEIISLETGDLTFYSTAFLKNFPTSFGKLTFTLEPGTHLENVVVNVKPPRMRIRGRVLLKDGTPLANTNIGLTVRRRQRKTHLFIFPAGGSGGSSGRGVRTDAEGYFVSYYPDETSEYSVIVKYEGASAKSRWFRLKEGQRNDKLVLVLKDLEEHRVRRSERVKARLAVWVVNSENDHAYKRIKCDSWEDATAKAEAENAYLVTINDETEQKWLEAVYPEKAFFWIGLRVPEKGRTWQWSNGEPFNYANWVASQESDNVSTGAREIPIAMEFFSKRWMAIGSKSPFLPMVKYAILEKERTLEATQ